MQAGTKRSFRLELATPPVELGAASDAEGVAAVRRADEGGVLRQAMGQDRGGRDRRSDIRARAPWICQIIVAPTYDQSRLIFATVERLALGSRVTRPVAKVTRTPYPRLTLAGSLIMARTADEDGRNLRGHSADRVIIDEAAYVRDSVVTEVIAPMLADRNGRLVMISTPFGRNHFYRAFMRGVESRGRDCKSARHQLCLVQLSVGGESAYQPGVYRGAEAGDQPEAVLGRV